ncbi:17-beta-hydroxysteroid dehydrogenase type 12 [Oopsacas minuta]|uniref:17-beta-hydroxysteroid dehydrogenase type 12 n=1 Tax=Oopsacas minuta TaxID=111878 RepID=A0AAV7JVW9_9METZ|nr:17-beta-hydroxysteroid dehydrogenase type 12 [Oopsacas minuta]
MITEFVFLVGVILIAKFVLCGLLSLVYCFYVFFLSKTIDFKKYGKWAVVTGATDGIGKAYAKQLAKRGMSIVLVSRTLSKLEAGAAELRDKYNVETKVIAADFSKSDIYDMLTSELAGLEIGVLVNNVGMSYDHPEYFHEISKDVLEGLINVNTLSVAEMTRIVLPRMLECEKGIIINIGSLAGEDPVPLLAEYSATKAFVSFFTRCIQYEYRNKKSIIIQYIPPGIVSTKLSKMRPGFFSPDSGSYVNSALRSVGKLPVTPGCFAHEIQVFLTGLLPKLVIANLTEKATLSIRARALKKKEKPKVQ